MHLEKDFTVSLVCSQILISAASGHQMCFNLVFYSWKLSNIIFLQRVNVCQCAVVCGRSSNSSSHSIFNGDSLKAIIPSKTDKKLQRYYYPSTIVNAIIVICLIKLSNSFGLVIPEDEWLQQLRMKSRANLIFQEICVQSLVVTIEPLITFVKCRIC